MQEVFLEAKRLAEAGQPFALCTVVDTLGSTPQKPGAMLLVRADGAGVGTLGGGCIEADVWAAATSVLSNGGGPSVSDFVLNDDLAAESGMVCGGAMTVLVDPVRQPAPLLQPVREVLHAYAGGRGVAVATIIGPDGAEGLGARMYIREDGSTLGSLGHAELSKAAVKRARDLLVHGGTDMVETPDARVFLQGFVSPPHLVLCGAGHIAHATAPLAKALGFLITVIDDRPLFANRERFPMADTILVEPVDKGLRQVRVTPNTFIVIATRGHKLDDVATLEAARSPAGYVGLVGSVRKSLLIFEELLAEGVPYERVAQVHAPVGLDIGARTPEEIALSIMAEITQVRLGGAGGQMKMADKHLKLAAEKARTRTSAGIPK